LNDADVMTSDREIMLLGEARRDGQQRVFTRSFTQLLIAQVAQSVGMNVVFTSVPLLIVAHLGFSTQIVGFVVALQFVLSLLARLPVGHLIDQRIASGRGTSKQITVGGACMILGCVVFVLAGLENAPLLLVAAAIATGAGASTFTTAMSAELAHSIPAGRRAEAMGYFGIAQTIGTGVGAGSSFLLYTSGGILAPFAVGAALYAVATIVAGRTRTPHPFSSRGAPIGRFTLEYAALPAALAAAGLIVGQSSSTAFVPLLGVARGIANPGIFYFASAGAAVLLRTFGGRIADRRGPLAVIVPSLLSHSAGLMLLSQASSTWTIAVAGVAVGLGFAGGLTTIQSLAIDLAEPAKRGSALAMVWAAIDVGAVSGVLIGGTLAATFGYEGVYLVTSLGPAAGAIGLVVWDRQRDSSQPPA
jgi:MFS family permease